MHRPTFFSLLLPGALVFLVALLNLPLAVGKAVNRSIDDTLGDSVTGQRPLFLPTTVGVWEDNTCKTCALQPPVSSAFAQTYTAATYNSGLKNISITFEFTGTAIYVFFILANAPASGITAATAANFTLDGTTVGSFAHSPNSSAPAFQFNQSALAFSKTGLKNATHQMVISTSGLSQDIFVNFDYALYTFQDAASDSPSTTPSSTSHDAAASTGSSLSDNSGSPSKHTKPLRAIVAAVVGGLAFLGALIVGFVCCSRHRRQKHELLGSEDHDVGNTNPGIPQNSNPFTVPAQQQYYTSEIGSGYQSTNAYASRPSFSVYGTQVPSETMPSTIPSTDRNNESFDSRRRHSRFTEVSLGATSSVDSPLQYQNRSVFSTLPSGEIVMSAGTTRDSSQAAANSATLPPSRNLDNGSLSGSSVSYETPTPPVVATASNPKAELRRMRQRELERQMRVINEEIEELRTEARERAEGGVAEGVSSYEGSSRDSSAVGVASRSSTLRRKRTVGRSADEIADVGQLKDQIKVMTEQIAFLQSQQNSAWAQGLSDEPPPGYSPSARANSPTTLER
ncbi:hypothetical protein GYMLUDRAFT_243025 [Collybiopsis luxurians FD-317 M1]|uniref:Uncharacterized protein n=1 Tax=Collybiopsis luxurians FD-317 M1 TaxID=944289 RepID=A0A0D0CGT0_9AGAR|nr:hypothetical protein GYMLUDRAFT_243025 [Collybiopsis luxurians FD-317 M1]